MSEREDWLETQLENERDDRRAAIANGEIEPLTEKETAFWLTQKAIGRCLTPPEPKVVPKVLLGLEDAPAIAVEHIEMQPTGSAVGVLHTDLEDL